MTFCKQLILLRYAPGKERLELIQAGLVHNVDETEIHDGEVHHCTTGGDGPVLLPLLVDALAHLPRGYELVSDLDGLLFRFRKSTFAAAERLGQSFDPFFFGAGFPPALEAVTVLENSMFCVQ